MWVQLALRKRLVRHCCGLVLMEYGSVAGGQRGRVSGAVLRHELAVSTL